MEKYKQTLKTRRTISIVSLIAMGAIITLLFAMDVIPVNMEENSGAFMLGFQSGLLVVFIMLNVKSVVSVSKALKDDEKLKEMHIVENDERSIKIRKEVESTTSAIFTVVLLIATVVAGFFSNLIFYTLLAAMLVFVGIKGISKLVYNRKY